MQGREKYFPRELSGGQQQRVGLARSLAAEPDVWFLDEPFSALDPLIRKEMQNEFLRLQNMLHKTIVFITHDFDEAIRLADRIAIMFEGQIVQIGTAEELITNPATDYVAEFTRDIPRAKLLSVGSLMQPTKRRSPGKICVNMNDRISSIASVVLMQPDPVSVLDEGGTLCGELCRDAIAAILLDTDDTGKNSGGKD